MLSGKLKTIWWFVKRPQFLPHFFYIAQARLLGKLDTGGERIEATKWCQERAITTAEAIKTITQKNDFPDFNVLFPEIMSKAQQIADLYPSVGGAGDLNLLYHLCEFVKAERVVETGVGCGWSSLAVLLSLKNRLSAKLISNDMPYVQADYESIIGCVVPDELKKQWTLKKFSDRMALPSSLKELGTIDLCHYDSDKNYIGRMWAYPLLWKALRGGGIFISDDIGDNMGFRDFCEKNNLSPIIIELTTGSVTKHIGVVVKQ
ncbi:MAG: class I SAM-dependent methyltransferase [Bacteroidia bacterium]